MNDGGFGRRIALAEVQTLRKISIETHESNTKKTFVTGIKFLWWTWHDTDAPIDYRILGVPIGSTVWVITFTGE